MSLASDFDYTLPPELIATHPAPDRDGSRLLVLHRESGEIIHAEFRDLARFLQPEDLLVLNNSRVIPAALTTVDGKFEILLLEETSPGHWVTLIKPGKKAPVGTRLRFRQRGKPDEIEAEVLKTLPEGERVLRFFGSFRVEDYGEPPLPPYILKQRKLMASGNSSADSERYQTVYAEVPGSVAAPTAGLHFTPELLARFPHAFVTLHVGLGTFRPVKTENIEDHVMHEERFAIPAGLAEKAAGAKRIVAVGTTSARVLESVPNLQKRQGKTRIFIHPPYAFRHVEALITNFHLPKSTLLMLVCALGGQKNVLRAYQEAIAQKYRFFSYGDAMMIL